MFTSLICGSFHEQEREDEGPLSCENFPRSTKKARTKRNSLVLRCWSYKGQSKNPYSRVGLDHFSALLSDLEERKKDIYLQKDSQDIMFVRFVYSGSEEVVPIVVKSRDRKKRRKKPTEQQVKEEQIAEAKDKKVANCHKRRIKREMDVSIFVVVILLLLMIFGRSFVILCMSIGWYLVPTLKEKTSERTSSSSVLNNNMKKISGEGSSSQTCPKTSTVYRG